MKMVSPDLDGVLSRCREYGRRMSPRDMHHGYEHSLRVREYALEIGEREGADLEIVEMASYLHDIGRGHEEDGEYHTLASARLAASFLKGLGLQEEKIEQVVHCIECHSRKEPYRKTPQTLEAKVLYDADGLEMIGAVGMLRMALSASVRGKGWDHVLRKAEWRLKIMDDFLTAHGEMISKRRGKLVSDFIDQLICELKDTVSS